jgi:carbonic anhydrase
LGLSRRGLLGAFSAGALAATLPGRLSWAAGAPPTDAITGDEALERLMEGNALYVADKTTVRDFGANRAAHAKSQAPIASILSCADSRVGPEFLFNRGPGDLFVVRVAGNVLENDGLASLEYGAQFLHVPLILVLGHSNCGAVKAAIDVVDNHATLPGHLPGLIDLIKPAVLEAQKSHPSDLWDAAITENVRHTVQAVTTAKPVLADLVAGGKVKVVGGVYDIATGRVSLLS